MMTDSMVRKDGVLHVNFSHCAFPFDHIPFSHSYLYSILFLTLLYILLFFMHLGCVCLPRFWLFCLWFGFLVLFFVCAFVIWFSCCCWCSFVLQEQHVISHRPFLVNDESRTLHLCRFDSKSSDHHPHANSCCKQFVELARCERVMTTRAEFHFSWVYTFSATPRFLRIWAPDPPRETG